MWNTATLLRGNALMGGFFSGLLQLINLHIIFTRKSIFAWIFIVRRRMPEELSAAKALYMGMEVVIAVSSVIGNVMVVWAVKINKSLRDTTFCFIVSLALADIAVGALVIPLAITISIGLQTHFYSCLLVACTVLVLTQSSILALLAIAIDRYLRVKIPTR